jgi:LysR family hydrogen peroxide-inducible transcriptional activator
MARQPTLKQLRYLTALAEHQHFGIAASACHVSQSTLSAGIQELESLLDAALVERANKQAILTPLGEEIVTRAHAILLEVGDIMSLCESAAEPFSGKLRLGVIPTIAPFMLPDLFKQLRQSHPQLQLYIREDLSDRLVAALQQGELDVLLLALPFPADNVKTMSLFRDPFLLACPPSHALAQLESLSTEDLRDQPLLLLEDGHCLREHALEACKLRDSDISVPYQATSLNTIVQMVANGIGLTLLPQMAVNAHITDGTGLHTQGFSGAEVARTIGLMWRVRSPRAHEFRLLGEFIKQHNQMKPDSAG